MSRSPLEQALLDAGKDDAPDEARKAKVRAMLLASAGGAAALAGSSTVPKAATSVAKRAMWLKVVAGMVGTTLLVVALTQRERARTVSPVTAPVASPAIPSASPPVAPTSSPEVARVPEATTVTPTPPPSAPRRSTPSVASSPTSSSPPPAAEDPLAVEARLLHAARACQRAGDHPCVASTLAEHARRFPGGALRDEADVLAIDDAIARGDRAEASRLAKVLVTRAPNGPWSARVRALAHEAP